MIDLETLTKLATLRRQDDDAAPLSIRKQPFPLVDPQSEIDEVLERLLDAPNTTCGPSRSWDELQIHGIS
jgi:hypothetical protein